MCDAAAPNVTRIRPCRGNDDGNYRTALLLHIRADLDLEFEAVDLTTISDTGLRILNDLLRARVAPVGVPTMIDALPED